MRTASPLCRAAATRLADIDALLDGAYGSPEADLGNKPDPLDEAIYIILSFQTDLARFKSTWSRLRTAYPSWDALERAHLREVVRVLRKGGLHKQKARTIRRLLADVREVAGELSLDLLRTMNDTEAERLLTRLPGLSWKAARCILLYSLGRDALPVDGNTFRILKRTGVLSRRAVYRRRTLHDAIQAAVPPARRRSLHVNLVVHGQRTCLPHRPQCSRCILSAECPRIGIAAATRGSSREVSAHVRAKLTGEHART
jgi:endonuclease III